MNCIEARRRVLVHPGRRGVDVERHLEKCSSCGAFAERAADLDLCISAAIGVSVPWDLAPRVAGAKLGPRRRSRRRFLALASATAVVVFSAGLGAIFAHDDPEAAAAIDFVVDEEAAAILWADAADPRALRVVVATLGIRLPSQLGALRYIGPCTFMGAVAYHVIATTAYGKVTMLLVPGVGVDRRKSAHARGLHAIICACPHGCLVIVGESLRSVVRIAEMVASRNSSS